MVQPIRTCVSLKMLLEIEAEPLSSVGSVADLRTGGRWFDPRARPIFFPRIDYSHCDRIHSSLIAVRYFDDGFVGKQPISWKVCCEEYWLKELQKAWIGAMVAAI